MKILVTGGAGMIGSNLVKKLTELNHTVIVVDDFSRGSISNLENKTGQMCVQVDQIYKKDLKDPGALNKILEDIDVVYHLADIVAGIDYVFKNQLSIFHDNILINTNVVRAVARSQIKRYIYVGTACSFPKELQNSVKSRPLKEEDQYPASPESAYGWSKLMGEYEAELLQNNSNIKVGILSLHNVYGAPCDFSIEKSQVIPSLIHKRLLKPNEDLEVWGTGEQGRAFVHVDDVVKALIALLNTKMNQGVIQIGPDECTTIKEIAETVIKTIPGKGKIKFDTTKPTGDIGRSCDYTKAKQLLDWEPTIQIDAGIEALTTWIKSRL